MTFVAGDITDLAALERTFDEHGITSVIHLAALQVPFCRADPPLGALVNVVGTVNLFEAVKRRVERMAPLVYTSSIGMFAPTDANPATGQLEEDADRPPDQPLRGLQARQRGHGPGLLERVGRRERRPAAADRLRRRQGPGHDQRADGAIAAAVLDLPYTIAFGGRTTFQYADDVARTLIQASRSRSAGRQIFNLGGDTVALSDWVAAIDAEVPGAAGRIEVASNELPFPADIEATGISALGPVAVTPFRDGIRATVDIYRRLARMAASSPPSTASRCRPRRHPSDPLCPAVPVPLLRTGTGTGPRAAGASCAASCAASPRRLRSGVRSACRPACAASPRRLRSGALPA